MSGSIISPVATIDTSSGNPDVVEKTPTVTVQVSVMVV